MEKPQCGVERVTEGSTLNLNVQSFQWQQSFFCILNLQKLRNLDWKRVSFPQIFFELLKIIEIFGYFLGFLGQRIGPVVFTFFPNFVLEKSHKKFQRIKWIFFVFLLLNWINNRNFFFQELRNSFQNFDCHWQSFGVHVENWVQNFSLKTRNSGIYTRIAGDCELSFVAI